MTALADVTADLPAYYAADPSAAAVLAVLVAELSRLEAAADALRVAFAPQNADDANGTLGMWERVLRVPAAAGATEVARRAGVLAALSGRNVRTGARWTATLAALVGTFTVAESGTDLTVRVPANRVADATALLARITPAHLGVTVTASGTFTLDFSALDGTDTLT